MRKYAFYSAVLACFVLVAVVGIFAPLLAQQYDDSLFKGMKWRLIGPYRGGRALTAVGIPGNPNVFYFGAVAGGVWKTTDAGSTWQPLWDKQSVSSIGSIAISESDPNVIYVGTGEACIRGNISYGDGVYKSTDAGQTWKHIGLRDTRHIGRVLVHPSNPDIVYVAALGHAYGPNTERGVFRSLDGGKSWEKVLYKDDKSGAIDISFDRNNPRILYAALWEANRSPWGLTSGGPGSGLYKSTDAGSTWVRLTNSDDKALQENGLPKGILGKIGVSVSGGDGNRVYALIEAEKGGLYRTDDGGAHWTRVNDDRRFQQRAWYYTHVFADPKSPETVYILNVGMFRSTDAGQKFDPLFTPHGDYHGLWIDPTNPQRLINTNDGGATISVDGGKSWTRQDNQPTAQFYHVITDNRWPYFIYGAQQDNSTVAIASRSDRGVIDRQDWYPIGGGESGYIAPDPRDPNLVYAGSYQGYITRFDKRTGQSQNITAWPEVTDGHGAASLKYRIQWTTPILLSIHDPNVLYQASQFLLKSTNGGATWTPISPDLTRNDKSKQVVAGGPITKEDTGAEYYNVIFAVAESPLAKDLIWAGADDGLVHLTRDAGKSWTNVTPKDLPESLISIIEASPHDAGTAYLAVDRHKFDDFRPYIYKTTDFGKSWSRISAGIPEGAYVRSVREDPRRKGLLFAGTETGVYISFDDGAHWQPLKLNLPVAPIHDLVVKDDDLIVATHGRSFWVLDNLTPLRQLNPQIAAAETHFFTPQTAIRFRGGHSMLRGRPVGENPPDGAILDYYFKAAPKDEVTLEILDSKGALLRKYSSKKQPDDRPKSEEPEEEPPLESMPAEAGMNRFVWNLRTSSASKIPGYSLGDYLEGERGPLVPPGDYTARLNVSGKAITVPFAVKADPRISASQSDLEKQFDLGMKIHARLTQTNDAVNQIRDLRNQLKALRRRLPQTDTGKSIRTSTEDLDKKITPIEEELIQVKMRASQDSLNYPSKLDAKFAVLAITVDSADTAPTAQSFELFADLEKRLEPLLSRWKDILAADVVALNQLLQKENVPFVSLPAPSPAVTPPR